jgi:Cobalamin biosynthesis protein CobN and related Mg-chelatases
MALRWSILKRTPIKERKIAILLYQYTGETEALGDAGGLDTPQSVIGILQKLKNGGYIVDYIPETGNELIEGMIAGLTNDTRWISEKQMRERTVDLVSPLHYQEWFTKIPMKNQEKISADWGPIPGEVLVADGDFCIPGHLNGNIFIGIQPPRGLFEKVESLIHSK